MLMILIHGFMRMISDLVEELWGSKALFSISQEKKHFCIFFTGEKKLASRRRDTEKKSGLLPKK